MRHVAKPRSTPTNPIPPPPENPDPVRSTYAELSVRIVTKYGAASSILIYFGEHRTRLVFFLARFLRSGSIDSRFSIAAFDFSSLSLFFPIYLSIYMYIADRICNFAHM